ncbi:hypothetical protein LPJ75_000585, partial [Coemansia sp. RSA 2598]
MAGTNDASGVDGHPAPTHARTRTRSNSDGSSGSSGSNDSNGSNVSSHTESGFPLPPTSVSYSAHTDSAVSASDEKKQRQQQQQVVGRQSLSSGAPHDVDENGEPVISFGEPLHVS